MTTEPTHAFGLVVVKPVGCVNCDGSNTPRGVAAAVVTRILYVRFTSRPGAGVKVAIVFPPNIEAAPDENAMHEAKLSSDTWMEPEQAPAVVWPVSVAGFIATVN